MRLIVTHYTSFEYKYALIIEYLAHTTLKQHDTTSIERTDLFVKI